MATGFRGRRREKAIAYNVFDGQKWIREVTDGTGLFSFDMVGTKQFELKRDITSKLKEMK